MSNTESSLIRCKLCDFQIMIVFARHRKAHHPSFQRRKTVFYIKSQLVSHENKFHIQPPHEHYHVKAVEINISECEIWGEGKTEADLVRITVI